TTGFPTTTTTAFPTTTTTVFPTTTTTAFPTTTTTAFPTTTTTAFPTTTTTTFPTTTSSAFPTTTTTGFPITTTSGSQFPTSSPSTPSFYEVNILIARNVQLQATSSPSDYSTKITCDDPSVLPYVQANVTEDSILIILATTDCDVTIRAYTYQAIHIDSVSRLIMTDYFYKGYQLRLLSMGNSQIQISNIGYDLAEFIFLGNSTAKLSGNIGKLTVVNLGKGSVDATSIATPSVNATLTGTGSLHVKSTANMNLIFDGTGIVTWCSPRVQMDVTLNIYKKQNILYQC
ncbi:unnamed protein product, partial [Rotaria sp. Silwood1]